MTKRIENKVVVFNVERANRSVNGNPAFVFNTDRGAFRTQSDTNAAYRLENDFVIGAVLDVEVTLICTPAGRVFDWKL